MWAVHVTFYLLKKWRVKELLITNKKIGLINQYVHKVKLRHWSERMLLLCVFFAIIIDSFDLIFTCFLFLRVNKVVSNLD